MKKRKKKNTLNDLYKSKYFIPGIIIILILILLLLFLFVKPQTCSDESITELEESKGGLFSMFAEMYSYFADIFEGEDLVGVDDEGYKEEYDEDDFGSGGEGGPEYSDYGEEGSGEGVGSSGGGSGSGSESSGVEEDSESVSPSSGGTVSSGSFTPGTHVQCIAEKKSVEDEFSLEYIELPSEGDECETDEDCGMEYVATTIHTYPIYPYCLECIPETGPGEETIHFLPGGVVEHEYEEALTGKKYCQKCWESELKQIFETYSCKGNILEKNTYGKFCGKHFSLMMVSLPERIDCSRTSAPAYSYGSCNYNNVCYTWTDSEGKKHGGCQAPKQNGESCYIPASSGVPAITGTCQLSCDTLSGSTIESRCIPDMVGPVAIR